MSNAFAAMKDRGAAPYIAVLLTVVLTFLTTVAFRLEATAQAAREGTIVNSIIIEEHKTFANDRYDRLLHTLNSVDQRAVRMESKIDKLLMSR